MLEVCLLGTGGMMPLPYRWLTSLMVRYNGKSILIDCGEGTQIAMKEKGWSPKPIDVICFTHFHADHISGLPGMLLTMGNAERTEPLTVIGPKGLTRTVNALRVIAPELPFDIRCIEFEENEQTLCFDGLRIEAFRVNHNVVCYGYSLSIDRAGKFQLDKAEALGIERRYWNKLTENQQAAVMEAAADTQAFNADLSETAENKVLDELKSSGCNVIDVPDKAPWQEACAKVISENTSDQAELYQQLLDMKA